MGLQLHCALWFMIGPGGIHADGGGANSGGGSTNCTYDVNDSGGGIGGSCAVDISGGSIINSRGDGGEGDVNLTSVILLIYTAEL